MGEFDNAHFAKGLWAVYGEELPEPPYLMIRRVLTYLESYRLATDQSSVRGTLPTYPEKANGGD